MACDYPMCQLEGMIACWSCDIDLCGYHARPVISRANRNVFWFCDQCHLAVREKRI